MKYILRPLTTHAHILLISLLVVGLSFGMVTTPRKHTTTQNSQKKPSVTTLLTSPADDSGQSTRAHNNPGIPAKGSSGSSYGGPGYTDDNEGDDNPGFSGSAGSSAPASPPTQTQPFSCTTCGHHGCDDDCPPASEPEPEPEPAPQPAPISGCGICGSSPVGRSTMHVMCPMYCVQMDQ